MHHHPRDVTLWVASLVFLSLGVGEIAIGQLIASHVLLVLGVHNIFDGGLLAFNAKAESWEDIPDLDWRPCILAPMFAIGTSLAILLSALWTAFVSRGGEVLTTPGLALAIGTLDVLLNFGFARGIKHQHHHHAGGNRSSARAHLLLDGAVGLIGMIFLGLVWLGATQSDNWGGILGSILIIWGTTKMMRISIANYRRHLPRHNHVHHAADHHHG